MRIFAYGRLLALPSRTWERVLAQQGGSRARRIGDADIVVVGAGAAIRPTEKIERDLARAQDRERLSERSFLRRLKLLPPLPEEARPFDADDLARRAKLSRSTIDMLALFDIIEGVGGRFGFREMKAASEAGKLLDRVTLPALAFACRRMRDALGVGAPLSELPVTTDQAGVVVLRSGDRLTDLDGQFRLGIETAAPELAELLADADAARSAGEDERAERLLRRALAQAPKDLDALFELGSLLCEAERFSEGLALLGKATRLKPGFADAWYNIGCAHEQRGRRDEARSAYERAIAADPSYADPLYNLGMIELDESRYGRAIELLDGYLALDPSSDWAGKARKAAALARLSSVKASQR
jgi:tetratricopeptide (TPR) repeat protein